MFGCNGSTITIFFKKYGLKARSQKEIQIANGKSFKKKEELYQEFLKLVQTETPHKMNVTVFCDLKKINYASFYQFIRLYHPEYATSVGVTTVSERQAEAWNNKRKIKDSDLEDIKHLYYVEKKTYKEIGEIYNCNDASVCNFFKRFGLEPRSKSENGKMVSEKFPELIERQRIIGSENYLKKRKYGTKPEKRFAEYCTANSIEFIEQYRKVGNAHPYDFFLPEYNTIVEIDGTYWHTKHEQIEKDKIQTEQALEKGYNVIRIDTDELKKNKNSFDPWYNEIKRMERFNGERKRGRLLEVKH